MKRIGKDGKNKKLNIEFIYSKKGVELKEILKEGYLCYMRNLTGK